MKLINYDIESVRTRVWQSTREQLCRQIYHQAMRCYYETCSRVLDPVVDQCNGQVGVQVWNQVWDQVRNQSQDNEIN
jgi:hypothetical protein